MRRIISTSRTVIAVGVLAALLATSLLKTCRGGAADAPSLVISQIKITSSNGQSITLYNTTDVELDMSKYQLEYFNNYDLRKASSSRLISLNGMVPPHGYFVVNDDAFLLCYKMTVDSVSLGLSSTAGMVEVLGFNQSAAGASITPSLQDYVSWSKTAASGAQTLPASTNAFLRRQPTDDSGNPAISSAGSGSWQTVQHDPANPCGLITLAGGHIDAPPSASLLPSGEPPATIVSAMGSGQAIPTLPVADIGLMAPAVNELLPNPNGTGNDSTDEFIELYNANAKPFDLSNFSLQTGLATFRHYVFPPGTSLPGHAFTAFYASKTGLSLSNSGSQVKLLDPFGNNVSTSGTYTTAKDGQAWALAKNKWYWTATPTPGKANVIKQPTATKKGAAKKATTKTRKIGTRNAAHSGGGFQSGNEPPPVPIHAWTLAIVGGVALLYGAYEYRADLANSLYELRRNFAARRSPRT